MFGSGHNIASHAPRDHDFQAWNHYAITWDASTEKRTYFINGAEVFADTITADMSRLASEKLYLFFGLHCYAGSMSAA